MARKTEEGDRTSKTEALNREFAKSRGETGLLQIWIRKRLSPMDIDPGTLEYIRLFPDDLDPFYNGTQTERITAFGTLADSIGDLNESLPAPLTRPHRPAIGGSRFL